jgi:arsenite methyltransferase
MKMSKRDEKIKKAVREAYGRVAQRKSSCCGPAQSSCCGTKTERSESIGYSDADIKGAPDGADLGLGCGNPVALASLKPGETVLDLGSGAGFDCFLAAERVGKEGKVIGVDMTPEMIDKARANAEKGDYGNVEFRLGEIEHLPAADNSMDAVMSNCVINLSPDKSAVLDEAYRVLKPGGRLSISDLALRKELPEKIRSSVEAYVGCIGGAILLDDYKEKVRVAGFKDIKLTINDASYSEESSTAAQAEKRLKLSPEDHGILSDTVVSIYIEARK